MSYDIKVRGTFSGQRSKNVNLEFARKYEQTFGNSNETSGNSNETSGNSNEPSGNSNEDLYYFDPDFGLHRNRIIVLRNFCAVSVSFANFGRIPVSSRKQRFGKFWRFYLILKAVSSFHSFIHIQN